MAHVPAVWVLRDDRAGHNAQSHGLAHRFGVPYSIKPIEYNMWAKLPNTLLGASLKGLKQHSKEQITPPWPQLVIAAGRRIIPIAKHIKMQSPDTILLQLMWPGCIDPFDLIIAPEHDTPPQDSRILTTVGAMHLLTESQLNSEATKIASQFDDLPGPHIAVMIGGNSKHGKFEKQDIQTLLDLCEFMAKEGSLLISTSRRTPSFVPALCEERLTCPYYLYDWKSNDPNPYPGLLRLADAIVVTGDSISMCSEACYSSKPVFIYNPKSLKSRKHLNFQQSLLDGGYAFMLSPNASVDMQPKAPLDEMSRIVSLIKSRPKSK